MFSRRIDYLLPAAAGILSVVGLSLAGCSGHGGDNGAADSNAGTRESTDSSASRSNASSQTVTPVSASEAARIRANELGKILVLEYHNITDEKKGQFFQPPSQLRGDLQSLYDNGFVTLDIHDFLTGNITTPAGKTPVVLTFDDASKSQFRYLEGTNQIDPNCAVGILDAFGAAHPDFGNHATFFVLPEGFAQPASKADKYRYLVAHGYAIGNHTVKHDNMTHMTPDRIQAEVGGDNNDIHKILPDYNVNVMAYPFGTHPKPNGKYDYTYIANGTFEGHPYHLDAGLLVGAEPSPSPYSTKFKPYEIPRVQARLVEGDVQQEIQRFKKHPLTKFISDGDPNTVSIPKSLDSYLNHKAVGSRKIVEW